uniref:Uncharacterized protein n=1 Tax=Nothoprocta perdicaria TaxID=30464 RepID=A0A8C6YMY1_NOTPE
MPGHRGPRYSAARGAISFNGVQQTRRSVDAYSACSCGTAGSSRPDSRCSQGVWTRAPHRGAGQGNERRPGWSHRHAQHERSKTCPQLLYLLPVYS